MHVHPLREPALLCLTALTAPSSAASTLSSPPHFSRPVAITNITTPAPTSGPYSDSWPLTCLAYCAATKPPDGPPYTYPFGDCMNRNASATYIDWVCTEANGFAPNECIPFHESAGCTSTNAYTTSTYWPSGYTSAGVVVGDSSTASSALAGSTTAGSTRASVTGTSSALTPTPSPNLSSSLVVIKIKFWEILVALFVIGSITR
jgi:hypothetical protein